MVYLEEMLEKSFGYQLDYLKSIIQHNHCCESPESSFIKYIFLNSGNSLFSISKNQIPSNINQQRLYHAPLLAALGYTIASNVKELDLNLLTWWKNGFSRLVAKEAFTHDRTSFFFRPIELLGISLGAISCPEVSSENLNWMKSILQKGEDKLDTNDCWTYLLGNLAASSLDVTWTRKSQLIPKEMKIEELALVKLLCDFPISITQTQEIKTIKNRIHEVLLERSLVTSEAEMLQDVARAAIVYCSLKATLTQVIRSCCRQYYEVANDSKVAFEFINCIGGRFHLATQQLRTQSGIQLPKEKLKNIGEKLLVIESDAKTALEVVSSLIEQKTSDLVVNNQQFSFIDNSINMSEYNLHNSKFGGGFAAEGSTQSGGTLNDYSIIIEQNTNDINRLISSLRKTIQQFPEEQREDAEMEIDDLEAEIVNPEKQDPKRFGRRLKRLAVIGTTVATLAGGAVKLSENANTFTDNIIELGEKLEAPVQIIKDKL